MLKVEQLQKGFGEKKVLKGVDLEVADASIYGLTGVNGAGKSTLLRCIAGVYEPEEGRALLDGRDTYRDAGVRGQLAFVADEGYFPGGMTIRARRTYYEDLYPSFSREKYEAYLKMFELEEKMRLSALSKGNRRRMLLVFAMALQPKLLLLDEAYDGLEPLARMRFRQALRGLQEEQKTSVIISSHNLRELEDICDSFGILEDGVILKKTPAHETGMHRYQLVFSSPKGQEDFQDLNMVRFEAEGSVVRIVLKGEDAQLQEELKRYSPILLEELPLGFEDQFMEEMQKHEKGDAA